MPFILDLIAANIVTKVNKASTKDRKISLPIRVFVVFGRKIEGKFN